ncbi:MAG: hypothetical protein KA319_06665 [Ferruginibacter sp.]|nr:hypothetical protein [Ferruginibacter sp.]
MKKIVLVKLFIAFFTLLLYSCKNYKENSIRKANRILANSERIDSLILKVESDYNLDFTQNTRYSIISGNEDKLLQNNIYCSYAMHLFKELDISEISLEKNSKCSKLPVFSQIIIYDNDGNTLYHFYKCNYDFTYKDEIENTKVYAKIINPYFEVEYEKE